MLSFTGCASDSRTCSVVNVNTTSTTEVPHIMNAINLARWVALVSAFVMGAVAEWKLGVAVGLDVYTAALLPLTLDVWGFAAFKSGRKTHVTGAITAMFAAQAVSHLLELGSAPAHMVALSVLVSAIAPGVSLACHRLEEVVTVAETVTAPEATPVDAPEVAVTAPVETVPAVVDAPAAPVTAEVSPVVDVAETVLSSVDVPAETVTAPVVAEVSPVDDADDAPMSTLDIAARAAELIAGGMSKTAAAGEMGLSRQWVHKCMRTHGLA